MDKGENGREGLGRNCFIQGVLYDLKQILLAYF